LICNLQNRFEKEKEFLNWKSASGRIRRVMRGAAARWIAGVHHVADPNPTR
jgi:hypothetical protein